MTTEEFFAGFLVLASFITLTWFAYAIWLFFHRDGR